MNPKTEGRAADAANPIKGDASQVTLNRSTKVDGQEIGALPRGKRNDGLTRLGGYLRRKGWEYPAIETELLRQNLRRCQPPLPDDDVRSVAASVSRYAPGGPDLLENAWTAIRQESSENYEQFVALSRELQLIRPEYPIVLPLKRIAVLMGCVWESVRGYRRQAIRDGLLYQVSDPIPHRRAAEYRVALTGSLPPWENKPLPPWGLPPNHGGDSGNGGSGESLSGESWEQVARLARRGFRLFPCRPRSKQPLLKRWPERATSDVPQLSAWFQKYANCNWALATGEGSKTIALDIDGSEGLESLSDCCVDWREIAQATLGVKTGRGSHLYFLHPGFTVRNSIKKLASGLDIRGDGGYVIVPPSTHESGEVYFWLGADETKPVAAAPTWLLNAVSLRDEGQR